MHKPVNNVRQTTMRNKTAFGAAPTSLPSLLLTILTCLLLSACSGGIFGTGDGGPIDVIDPDTNGTNSPGDMVSETVANGDSSVATDNDGFTGSLDVSQLVPQSLQQLIARNENISQAQQLATQLSTLQEEVATILNSLIAGTGIPDDNVSDAFDTTLRYTQANSETITASSDTLSASYFFNTNNERTIYLLRQNSTLTVRQLTRSNNTLLQATIISLPDGATVIEADLNQNGTQTYLQTYSTDTGTVTFAQHPTDLTLPRQRDFIDDTANILIVQNCTTATQDCDEDSNWTSTLTTGTAIDAQFSNVRTVIDNSLAGITSPLSELPDTVNEAVLTLPTDTDPTDEQIQCGLQRVSESVRAFCVLPQPLGATNLFSETLTGSEIFYQRLSN